MAIRKRNIKFHLNFVFNLLMSFSVITPEAFAEPKLLSQSDLVKNVRVFMARCQECHKDKKSDITESGKIPDLSVWPIGQDIGEPDMKYWVRRITLNLDLKNNGRRRLMPPPKDSTWVPTEQDLQMIKDWIAQGAPDETGKRFLE